MKKRNLKVFVFCGTMLRKMAGSVVVIATLLLSGCAVHNAAISSSGAPFYLAYNSDDVIRDQSKVATITSTNGLEVDGINVSPKNMRSANSGFSKGSVVVVDVLPGQHTVKVYPPAGTIGTLPTLTYNFEAGKVYNVAIKIIKVAVEENTSADVVQKIATNRNNAVFEGKK